MRILMRTYGVLGVWHSVEGSECHREFVDDEVIGIIFLLDDRTKPFLVFSTNIKTSDKNSYTPKKESYMPLT